MYFLNIIKYYQCEGSAPPVFIFLYCAVVRYSTYYIWY